MKILNNPSFLLATGYAIGQGSVFVVLILARYLGYHEISGVLVVVVSVLSFSFQFSDFGNPTYLVKEVSIGRRSEAISFIRSRGILACFICIIFSVWTYQQNQIEGLWVLLIFLPLIGFISGNYCGAFLEARGAYFSLAIIGMLPWLSMTMGMLVLVLCDCQTISMAVLGVMTLVICYLSLRLTRKNLNVGSSPVRYFLKVAPFLLSPLGGQIWYRYVIFTISSAVGLSALGAMGIARNIQIAILLCIGFIARPALRTYIATESVASREMGIYGIIKSYRYSFYVAFAPSLLLLLFSGYIEEIGASGIRYWLPIIYTIPITLIGQAAAAANQLRNGTKYLLISDYSCLIVNAVIFLLLVQHTPLWAIVASESAHAVALIVAYFIVSRIKNRYK